MTSIEDSRGPDRVPYVLCSGVRGLSLVATTLRSTTRAPVFHAIHY